MMDGNIRYKSSHIKEHYFLENTYGNIETDYRKYELTAKQAVQKFGDKTPSVITKIVDKEPAKKFEFLHVVKPDEENETNMPYVSYHILIEENELISVGGFRTFPYVISRWTTSANEVYGRSPA